MGYVFSSSSISRLSKPTLFEISVHWPMTNTVLDLERNWLVRPLEAEDVRRSFFFIFFITLGELNDVGWVKWQWSSLNAGWPQWVCTDYMNYPLCYSSPHHRPLLLSLLRDGKRREHQQFRSIVHLILRHCFQPFSHGRLATSENSHPSFGCCRRSKSRSSKGARPWR